MGNAFLRLSEGNVIHQLTYFLQFSQGIYLGSCVKYSTCLVKDKAQLPTPYKLIDDGYHSWFPWVTGYPLESSALNMRKTYRNTEDMTNIVIESQWPQNLLCICKNLCSDYSGPAIICFPPKHTLIILKIPLVRKLSLK